MLKMPNDCYNSTALSGPAEDIAAIRAALAAHAANAPESHRSDQKKWSFNALVPSGDAHDDHCANWGTKWDAYGVQMGLCAEDRYEVSYYTAWVPPNAFLRTLSDRWPRLTIRNDYEEPGMGFAGLIVRRGGRVIEEDEWEYECESDSGSSSDSENADPNDVGSDVAAAG